MELLNALRHAPALAAEALPPIARDPTDGPSWETLTRLLRDA
jgi:hypothetical protein